MSATSEDPGRGPEERRQRLVEPTAGREVARLWRLAWPVGLGMLGHVLMGTVDTIFVGQLGEQPLASLAIGNAWSFSGMVVGFGAVRALDPIVSQAHGAGDDAAVGRALSRGLGLALWLTLGLVPWFLLTAPGLRFLGQPLGIIPDASGYVLALLPGLPFAMLFNTLRAWLQGFEVMRPATVAILAANVVNVGLDLVLIHGLGPVPALGAVGAGLATSLCNAFLLLALLWLVRDRVRASWQGFAGSLSFAVQRPLLMLGLPLGLQLGLEVWAFNATAVLLGWFGETALAGHAIALNLCSLTFMYALGLSQAGATRVGNLIGADQPWVRAGLLAIASGGAGMGISAMGFLWFPEVFVALYTGESGVRAVAVMLLPIAGVFQVFDGLQVTMFGVLRGAGDVQVPTLANVLGYWLVGVPGGYLLAFRMGYGPVGVWYGLCVGLIVVSAFLAVRLAFVVRTHPGRVVA